jgi:hypothetical protein
MLNTTQQRDSFLTEGTIRCPVTLWNNVCKQDCTSYSIHMQENIGTVCYEQNVVSETRTNCYKNALD